MMTTNPWINRAAALLLLVTVCTLAYDYVHHEQKNHPAVYLGLKP
jgi:hypothetical protein